MLNATPSPRPAASFRAVRRSRCAAAPPHGGRIRPTSPCMAVQGCGASPHPRVHRTCVRLSAGRRSAAAGFACPSPRRLRCTVQAESAHPGLPHAAHRLAVIARDDVHADDPRGLRHARDDIVVGPSGRGRRRPAAAAGSATKTAPRTREECSRPIGTTDPRVRFGFGVLDADVRNRERHVDDARAELEGRLVLRLRVKRRR